MHWQPERNEEIFGRSLGLGQIVSREQALADVRALCDRWLGGVLEPQHRFVVEKAPADAAAVETVAKLYPDASIVHALRRSSSGSCERSRASRPRRAADKASPVRTA